MASWIVLGVPTSAGTHHAGMEQAPHHLREAGLVDRLRAIGHVTDIGDLPIIAYRSLGIGLTYRDGDRVTGINQQVASHVSDIVSSDAVVLVLGGDCTVTLGTVAGLLVRWPHLGVV